ncbi:hypothetical protein KNCP2_01240 [Candidatus Rickettsia kedanie]|uniref:Uncharacterized protein n=1 Tax=Candidatus Rickettsia kedanie TaxID=3115352 RepID=A0ABP9TRG7_9RICK
MNKIIMPLFQINTIIVIIIFNAANLILTPNIIGGLVNPTNKRSDANAPDIKNLY